MHVVVKRKREDNRFGLRDGMLLFQKYIQRPEVDGGPKPSASKRYHRVMRGFMRFAARRGIEFWQQVDARTLDDFAKFCRNNEHSDTYVSTVVWLIKTIHAYLIGSGHLGADHAFAYEVTRGKQSTTYCPTAEEIDTLLEILARQPDLKWLHDAALMLSHTGLRFGELAQLTSEDIDLARGLLTVRHDGYGTGMKSTKSGCDRTVPLTEATRALLTDLMRSGASPLFRGPRGLQLRSQTFAAHLRVDVLKPLGIQFPHTPFQEFTAHSFRKFAISNC